MPDSSAPAVEVKVTAVAVELPDLKTRLQWVEDWEEATQEPRELSARDRDYYDNKQWTDDEIQTLEDRKQPVITKNRIARKVNYILGEEIKKRVDPSARPRTPQHEDSARAATDALRYVEEEQRFDQARSAVLKNMLIEGYGGAIKGIEDAGNGELKHTLKHVEWDRLFYDPHSRAVDFGDAKYLGVLLWMDLDDAVLDYPEAADELKAAVQKGSSHTANSTEDSPRGWVDGKRKRVKIAEVYFRIDEDWYRAVYTEAADLAAPERTAYLDENKRHSLNPLVMESCYVDQNGGRYGVVRQLISPQDEINKRSSKALHLLSVNGVIVERDFIRDPQKFAEELAKPDGFAEVEAGALNENRLMMRQNLELAASQVQLLQQAQQDIDSIGPSASMLPDAPNSMSGRAFMARAASAAQELGTVFDQLRAWGLAIFKLDWCCIRQYWPQEKWLRVTDDEELTGYRFVALNQRMTRAHRFQELVQKGSPPPTALQSAAGEVAPQVAADIQRVAQQFQQAAAQAQQMGQPPQPPPQPEQLIMAHPLMQEQITLNQVDQILVDIVLDESPDTTVLAQEEFDTLTELLPTVVQTRPDMAPTMARLVVKASQLPNKRELLKELDKGPDPQAQQQQQQAQQLQQALAKAELDEKGASIHLKHAQAAKAETEAQLKPTEIGSKAELNKANAMNHAASAGEKMAMPGDQSGVLL